MSRQLSTRYDIIINGGGIVGFTLLNLLVKSPYLNQSKILLIERASRPTNFNQCARTLDNRLQHFSNRVSSITNVSKSVFKKLGVWDIVKPYTKDVKEIKVWNYDYFHKIKFTQDLPTGHNDFDEDTVFSTIENNRLSLALLENLGGDSLHVKTSIEWESRLTNLEKSLEAGLIDVTMYNEKQDRETIISAPLVLGCDGFRSKVRELAQIKYRELVLNKTAIVGTVKLSTHDTNSENNIAFQRFSNEKETVAALLPLDNEHCSFVISGPDDYIKHLNDCSDENFVVEFNKLLSNLEVPNNIALRSIHELANVSHDNIKSLLQIIGPMLGLSSGSLDLSEDSDEIPYVNHLVKNSRASFPLAFGSTSPRMVSSLPNFDRLQIALLGDAAHRIHPLAGQGLNLGIQDAMELVRQLDNAASKGERILHDPYTLGKALRMYELKRQAYVIPMSAGILTMQDLFKLAPTRLISSMNKCEPMKTASVRFANGC